MIMGDSGRYFLNDNRHCYHNQFTVQTLLGIGRINLTWDNRLSSEFVEGYTIHGSINSPNDVLPCHDL